MQAELAGKRLDLLRKLLPTSSVVGLLANPTNAAVTDSESRSLQDANQLLPGFLADYNARFGQEPHNPKNLHRPLSAGDDLADVFAWREERTVSNSLTLQYDKVPFLLEPNEITRELRRQRVTVVDYPDGYSGRSGRRHVDHTFLKVASPWRAPGRAPSVATTRRGKS